MPIKNRGIKAVAICFLHGYLNPDHEMLAGEVVRRLMPDAFVEPFMRGAARI